MPQPHIGEIMIFAGDFAPFGWAECAGQAIPISENETLFQLIGTTYGGDGQSTFNLPDLRGRVPIHMGNGYVLAQSGGVEQVTLTTNQIPVHSHAFESVRLPYRGDGPGNTGNPLNNGLGIGVGKKYYSTLPANPVGNMAVNMAAVDTDLVIKPEGGNDQGVNAAHNNMQPYIAMMYCISLFGVFPTQT